jgi:GntR family transcriptional regulator / MocR family aminotransferase
LTDFMKEQLPPPFIPFERTSSIPFYKQIYEGYRTAILSGRLRPGQRVVSSRVLASELRISRLPVVNAYEQLLHEGYIEGRSGAGTFVKGTIPDELSKPETLTRIGTNRKADGSPVPLSRPDPNAHGELGAFRVSLPALDLFPHKIWSRLLSRHAKNFTNDLMAYGEPMGYPPLREAIAEYLRAARAVQCEASQILIVSGSQMALQICAMATLKPGDEVCIEEPGYPGARDALRISGANLRPVPLDDEGIDVGKIVARGRRARAVYVTPSHQYPLGTSMTASRRLELLDWAKRHKSWILEDDYDSEYRYVSRPLGSLQGMDTASRVIYIGTFSKVLFPSLRLGYVVVPPQLFKRFAELRESLDIFSPTLYQLVLTDFLRQGHFARHVRRMRAAYMARQKCLLECIDREMSDILHPYNTDAGLHLTAFLNSGSDDCAIVRRAAENGISATALSTCYAGKRKKSGLILGFGGATERQIQIAAKTLARLIR